MELMPPAVIISTCAVEIRYDVHSYFMRLCLSTRCGVSTKVRLNFSKRSPMTPASL